MIASRQENFRPEPLDNQDQQILLLELCKLGSVLLLDSGFYSFADVLKLKGALTRILQKSMKRSEFENNRERRILVQRFL